MPTIYEVAAKANVSASIVSRILNDRPVRVSRDCTVCSRLCPVIGGGVG
ncbi:LacI family DNA-binding transcriptional regulator [Nonomuraea sp. NPDC005983]